MWLLLGQFDQHPACPFGMDKGHETPFGPNPRLVVNERDTLRLEAAQDGFQVIHAKADVVDAAAALGQKLPDGRIGTGRLQKFQAAFTDRKHRHFDTLFGDNFGVGQFQSQCRPVKTSACSMDSTAMPRWSIFMGISLGPTTVDKSDDGEAARVQHRLVLWTAAQFSCQSPMLHGAAHKC